MQSSQTWNAGTLTYFRHELEPEDLLYFRELSGFVDDWESLGLNLEIDLLALQVAIMANPKCGNVVPGTGGLRKMQFAPPRGLQGKLKGKRDSCRVCYVYFEEFFTVLLVMVYSKSQKTDLSPQEKREIHRAIERVQNSLARRYS